MSDKLVTCHFIFPGNCLVLLAISSCKHLRSISNLYIGNLALVDFIIGICTMPITVVSQNIALSPPQNQSNLLNL
jgi:hypothetical protein